MKKYVLEQVDRKTGIILRRFEESDFEYISAYYEEHRFEGEWLVFDKKNFGAKDYYHRVKITEEEYKKFLEELRIKKEKRRAEFMARLLANA